MKRNVVLSFFIFLTVVMFCAAEDRAKLQVKIDQIISSDYPNMTAYTVVQNAKGEIVQGLAPGLFKTRIDSMEYKMKTTVVPFSMAKTPIDYTILLSNSGIMDGEPLDFQKNAVLQFLDLLEPADTFSLYTIGEETVPVFEELKIDEVDATLINSIEVTSAQPRVYDSIIQTLRKLELRKTPRKVLIVISDGRDQNSRFTKEQLNTVLAEIGIPVYSIGIRILGSLSLSSVNELAEITGGTYIYSNQIKGIPDAIKKIHDIITRCYVIKYRIRNLKADDLLHHLEITVDERDSYGKGQKTFIAVKIPVPKWVRWLLFGIFILVLIVLIVLYILLKIRNRKRMGITKRRCTDCRTLMKDTWDECPFCRYLPDIKKKKKKKKGKA